MQVLGDSCARARAISPQREVCATGPRTLSATASVSRPRRTLRRTSTAVSASAARTRPATPRPARGQEGWS
eukprot:9382757-Alexandrium_andersonii.AAC.1